MEQPQQTHWTEVEYLAFERESDTKHEFIDGQIVAMTGASADHNLITASTIGSLIAQTRKTPCRVFSSDMRVRVPDGTFCYPDITLVCGEVEYTDDEFDTLANPTVIIEVLSPSTESYDRGKKFQDYWQIPSLQAYILIAQDQPRVERFIRHQSSEWLLAAAVGLDQTLDLPNLDCKLILEEIYEQVTFNNP